MSRQVMRRWLVLVVLLVAAAAGCTRLVVLTKQDGGIPPDAGPLAFPDGAPVFPDAFVTDDGNDGGPVFDAGTLD